MSVYLSGIGTDSDPYLIHDFVSLRQFLSVDCISASTSAMLVCDIDCGGNEIVTRSSTLLGKLDGKGFSISNLVLSRGGGSWYLYVSMLTFFNLTQGSTSGAIYSPYNLNTFSNVSFIGGSGNVFYVSSSRGIFYNCVFDTNISNSSQSATIASASYSTRKGGTLIAGSTDLRSSVNPYLESNFALLSDDLWTKDGASAPRPKRQDITSLTHVYAVKGTTTVGGVGKSRTVSVHGNVDFIEIKSINSSADGKYIVTCGYYTDHVYVLHKDKYGKKYYPSNAYAIGDVIHPSIPNGYRYICTTAGTSAATEPTAWPTTGTLTTGSAIFTPAPVYKPETMLVVPVLIDLVTGLPV